MTKVCINYLFTYKDFYDLGDLERFKTAIDNLPDEPLMRALINERGNGRNDYPIRPTWNSLIALILFEHVSIESLIRELKRNAQLRELCGFNPLKGVRAVPSSMAYSRFLDSLMKHQELIDDIFSSLTELLMEILPGFGKRIAFDGKAIQSLANKKPKFPSNDRRKENDADFGVKTYKGIDDQGNPWTKKKSWFGFRLHLICDANYEIPLAFTLTKASKNEQPVMRELVKNYFQKHPKMIENCDYGMGDKGYDSQEMICLLWEKFQIKPIIDIRNTWKDTDKTRSFSNKKFENATYDYKGNVYCHCMIESQMRKMVDGGFEKDRNALKFLCPVIAKGIDCKSIKTCPIKNGIRVPLKEDKRIFTPVSRSSHKWKRLYNQRTSIERVNSRLDVSFGFERHYIRGMKKMNLRCSLALCIMSSIALGRARQNRPDLMNSLVRIA